MDAYPSPRRAKAQRGQRQTQLHVKRRARWYGAAFWSPHRSHDFGAIEGKVSGQLTCRTGGSR